MNGYFPGASKHTGGDTTTQNLAFQAEVKGLRELSDLYQERLTGAIRSCRSKSRS